MSALGTVVSIVSRCRGSFTSACHLDPRSHRPVVPDGLRSSFRDWAAERSSYPRGMAEIALGGDFAEGDADLVRTVQHEPPAPRLLDIATGCAASK